jgi:hypothetical protein
LLESRLGLGSSIVVGQFHSNLACVFSLEVQLVPDVILPTARDEDLFEVHPDFPDQVIFLVLIEDRALQLVIVG